MATTIHFTYEGKDYTLEYTRRTVTEMEKSGFSGAKVSEMPLTTLPMLFAGAFRAHHRATPSDTIEKIYKKLPDKESLYETLVRMYNEPIEALMEEPGENEGNLEWTATR